LIETVIEWPFWLEFLQLLLSPHIVVTGAVLFVLLRFRKGFKELLGVFFGNLKDGKSDLKFRFGSDGVSFETSERRENSNTDENSTSATIDNVGNTANTNPSVASTNPENKSSPTLINKNLEDLLKVDQSPILLEETEKELVRILSDYELDLESDTARVLIRNLASTSIDRAFEKDYSLIRGSEVELLEKLNALAPSSMSVPQIDRHTEETRTKYPDFYTKSMSANEYLSFLLGSKFVLRTEYGFAITVRGSAFLRWLIVQNKPHNKSL
jgi:hypothetical protein